jgi:hypothetical protein
MAVTTTNWWFQQRLSICTSIANRNDREVKGDKMSRGPAFIRSSTSQLCNSASSPKVANQLGETRRSNQRMPELVTRRMHHLGKGRWRRTFEYVRKETVKAPRRWSGVVCQGVSLTGRDKTQIPAPR